MLKCHSLDFVAKGPELCISPDGQFGLEEVSLSDFLSMNMTGRVIMSAKLPRYTDEPRAIQTQRTSHRLQVRGEMRSR